MIHTVLPTIPIPAQTPDFPPTNELHVLDGKPAVPGARNRRRGLRALGWATLGSLSTAIVLVVTHPIGVHLFELSTGGNR